VNGPDRNQAGDEQIALAQSLENRRQMLLRRGAARPSVRAAVRPR